MIPEETDWMVSHGKDKYNNDFTKVCRWLQSKDARRVFFNANTSSRKAHNALRDLPSTKNRPTGIAIDRMSFYISQLSQPILMYKSLDSMLVILLTRNDSHYIAPEIWSQLKPILKQDIL
jgi:hypothetical protein